MSLVLIDLEMESELIVTENTRKKPQDSPLRFKATNDKLEQVSLGGHCHLDRKTHKAENMDQNRDQINGCNKAEKTKCKQRKDTQKTKKANYEKKEKDAKTAKYAQKEKDAREETYARKKKETKKAKAAQKEKQTKKAKTAQKEKQTKKAIEQDTVKAAKWGTLRRVVQAFTLKGPATPTSPLNGDELCCDDISFDGHLFEYTSHPPVIPKVDVPRLRLRPTLRERLYNIAHNLFRCGSMQQKNQYTLD